MLSSSSSGRPLPGWGSGVRTWPAKTRHTALAMAAFAGLTFTGCSGAPTSTANVGGNAYANVSVLSQPAGLRGALAMAVRHLSAVPDAATRPYHLVAFQGIGLDANGRTIPATNSQWTFTFSRYTHDTGADNNYDVFSVLVPGVGRTQVTTSSSQDAALSPIENWDAAVDPKSPDSSDLLAFLAAKNLSTIGATIALASGIVTIDVGGHQATYSTVDASFALVK